MPPQSKGKGKSTKNDVERPGVSWRDASLHGSTLILSVVKEAASLAPFVELKKAATVALLILRTIQTVRENKEAYERLGEDAGGLIVAIWRSYKKAEIPDRWLSPEMREILEDLTNTLEEICSFVQEQLSRNRAIRVIFSKADTVKINEYREHLNYAMQKFELQSHMNINDVLMQLVRKNDELSEQIQHRNEGDDVRRALEVTALEAADREAARIHEEEEKTEKAIAVLDRLKQVEIDNQARDERWQSDELRKIEKEAKDRQSELERLRAAASAIEIANRLKKAQEDEIAELRRKIAANEDSTSVHMQSSKQKSSRRQIEVEEEEAEWNGSIMVEGASSEEEEEVRQPVRKSSKVKINPSKSSNRRSGILEYTEDNGEDSRSVRSSKAKAARRTPSLRVQETEAEFTDEDARFVRRSKTNPARRTPSIRVEETEDEEEYIPPPQRKHPKVDKIPKPKMPPRKRSNPSIRVEETEDESISEEEYYERPPSRNNTKANQKSRNSSGTPIRDVDDLMSQIHGMGIGVGSPYGSRPDSRPRSPMYTPQYGNSFSPPIGTYGYSAGVPGSVVNSGVGNITNTTISNVGNNNSVRKVYHSPRSSGRR